MESLNFKIESAMYNHTNPGIAIAHVILMVESKLLNNVS